MKNYFVNIALLIILILTAKTNAGSSILSVGPKSLGEINYPFNVPAVGRGGVEMAISDSLSLNSSNFALWTQIPRTTITLNLLRYQGLNSSGISGANSSSDYNFNGGFLAFPLMQNKIAFGIALFPLITNDNKIQVSPDGSSAGTKQFLMNEGNISEADLVLSYAFSEQLSIAGVINYKFGRLRDITSIEYSEDGFGNIHVINDYRFYGTGLAIHGAYKINENFGSGIKFSFPSTYTLSTKQVSFNELNVPKEFRDVTLPFELSGGVGYKLNEHLNLGMDINFQNWENGFKIDNISTEEYVNSFRLGVGIEQTPPNRRFIPWSQKLNYRAGIFLGRQNRLSNNESVFEYGVALGFGMPILNIRNRIDLALEYGIRGNNSTNLIGENYLRFHLSISASELWFVQEED